MASNEPTPRREERPIARIPWIPVKMSEVKPEDNKFFQEMMSSGEEGARRLEFYRILNKAFPFYLPKRYHAMECFALHENSSNGQYWANATHFLYSFQTFGYPFHKRLYNWSKSLDDLDKFTAPLHHPLITALLKENIEECQSAAEFLLEPWVLIQLPFQPLLLHQWCIALLAEALKFHKEICDFYMLPIPKHLRRLVPHLFAMCTQMFTSHNICFGHLEMFIYHGQENVQNNVDWKFLKSMPETLAVLEFVLSDECRNVVKALKRMAWNKTTKLDFRERIGGAYPPVNFNRFDICYNMNYWKQKSPIRCMSAKYIWVEDLEPFRVQHPRRALTPSEWNVFYALIDEKAIKTGRIKDENRQVIFDAFGPVHVILPELIHQFDIDMETCSDSVGIQEQDCGVMYNIFCLSSDVRVAQQVAQLAFVVCGAVLFKYRTTTRIFIDSVDSDGPNMSFPVIAEAITGVKKSAKRYTFQNIFKRVKSTCFSPSREPYPDFKQGAEKIADHFQERIRNLVFTMLEKQFLARRGDMTVEYPERQFVQYLLPCFVASFVDLYKDPKVSQVKKEEYLQFIHRLVQSYENREYCLEITKVSEDQQQSPFSFFGICTFVEKSLCYQSAVKRFYEHFLGDTKMFTNLFDANSVSIFNHHFTPMLYLRSWARQIFMLFSRLNECLGSFRENPGDIGMLKFINYIRVDNKPMATIDATCLKLLTHKINQRLELSRPDGGDLLTDFDAVTLHQSFGIALFWFFSTLHRETFLEYKYEPPKPGPGFPLDPIDVAMWALCQNDTWTVKQQLSSTTHSSGRDDSTLAPLNVAKGNVCYEPVLKCLTPEGKVKMSRPGEITFFPVKHCRWCGLVETPQLKKCSVCVENPDYADVNYFCSEKCEQESLNLQHTEEHVSFLLIRLGIPR